MCSPWSPVFVKDMPGQCHAQYFLWTLCDHHRPHVAPQFLNRKIRRQPHAAKNLHAAVRRFVTLAVAEELAEVRVVANALPGIETRRSLVEQGPHRL